MPAGPKKNHIPVYGASLALIALAIVSVATLAR